MAFSAKTHRLWEELQMRTCNRCNCQMVEGFAVRGYVRGEQVSIKTSHKLFAKSLGLLSAAVCPNCGEVSMYLDDIEKRREEPEWDEIMEKKRRK